MKFARLFIAALLVFPFFIALFSTNGWSGETKAQINEDIDYLAVLEIGGAGEWDLGLRSFHPDGTLAIEFTPIEDKLEVELGMTALNSDGGIEIPVDFLLKRPYHLSRYIEFMFGIGPELIRSIGTENDGTFWGGEFVPVLMFWSHVMNVGFYVEPAYDFVFRNGVEHGLGATAGLIIALK